MKPPLAWTALAVACLCASQAQIKLPASTAPAPVSAESPRVSSQALALLEQDFEDKVKSIKAPEPFSLMGASSGFYLEGYGVVLTIPLDLINTPGISPFRQVFTKQDQEQVRRRKMAQLPALKQAVREMVASAAASLANLPMDRKISVAVRIYYLAWEDSAGLPLQIVATADRKSAQAGGIQLEEQ
jgi:hypothetical protein